MTAKVSPFSREDKERMRSLFKTCPRCGTPLGEDAQADAIFRGDHDHDCWTQGRLLCPKCHKETESFGKRRPRGPLGY